MSENNRATGRTTRCIDRIIQELFDKGTAIVEDHTKVDHINRQLLNTIKMRLANEHPHVAITDTKNEEETIKIHLVYAK
jgi:hypothetical protein